MLCVGLVYIVVIVHSHGAQLAEMAVLALMSTVVFSTCDLVLGLYLLLITALFPTPTSFTAETSKVYKFPLESFDSVKCMKVETVVMFTKVALLLLSVTTTLYPTVGIPSKLNGAHHVKAGQSDSDTKCRPGTGSRRPVHIILHNNYIQYQQCIVDIATYLVLAR